MKEQSKKVFNEWDKYLEKDLSNLPAFKRMINSVKFTIKNNKIKLGEGQYTNIDIEWLRIGILKEIDKKTDGNGTYLDYPEVATYWPTRLNKDNPTIVFKRISDKKIYMCDLYNIIFKVISYQDQIKENALAIPSMLTAGYKYALFSDLNKEIYRLKEFNEAVINGNIENHIIRFYKCVKAIPLKKEDVYKAENYEPSIQLNQKIVVDPFYMLVYRDYTYKILPISDIKDGLEEHLLSQRIDIVKNNSSYFNFTDNYRYVPRRISLNPKSKIDKVLIKCEYIKDLLNLESFQDVINNYCDYIVKNRRMGSGCISPFNLDDYKKAYLEKNCSKINNISNRYCKRFEIIWVSEPAYYDNKNAVAHIRFLDWENYDEDEFFDDYIMMPRIEVDKENDKIEIIGFDLVEDKK